LSLLDDPPPCESESDPRSFCGRRAHRRRRQWRSTGRVNRDDAVRAFIFRQLNDGARRSNEIHSLTAKKFGPEYAELAGPRNLLGKGVLTNLGSGGRKPRPREKYWALVKDVEIIKRNGRTTRTIKRFADDN